MIYIITRQPFPNGMAGTNRIKCYARAIKRAGIQCQILVFSRDSVGSLSQGEIDCVSYRYMCNFKKRWRGRLGSLQTFIMMLSLYIYLFFNLKKGDVVFEYARETYKYIYNILKLTHFKKAKFVSELCEVPGLGFKHREALMERDYIINNLFPRYDGVIAISDNLIKFARERTSKQCKFLKIPVLVDADEFQPR